MSGSKGFDKLIKDIEREMRYWGMPGAAYAAVKDGDIACIGGIGLRDREMKKPAGADTLFCIASCSKAFTGALASILISEGKLDPDRPVREYIKEFGLADPEADRYATLRDMLLHRTGLAPHDAMWPRPELSRGEFVKKLRYLSPAAGFRERTIYNNDIYGAVGYVLEAVSGLKYEELLDKYIFGPLGMKRSTCLAERLVKDSDHAEPYGRFFGESLKLEAWDCGVIASAANISSTASDMAKWLNMLCSGGRTPDRGVLIPEPYFSEMIKGQQPYANPSGLSEGCFPTNSYAFGWNVGSYKGTPMCVHTGKIEGYSSIQAFLPEKHIGAAFLMNFHNPAQPVYYPFVYTAFDLLLGEEPHDWISEFGGRREEPPLEAEYDDLFVDNFSGREVTPGLKAQTGVYKNEAYGIIKILENKGRLYFKLRAGKEIELKEKAPGIYSAEYLREDILTVRVPVTFAYEKGGFIMKAALESETEDIVFGKESDFI